MQAKPGDSTAIGADQRVLFDDDLERAVAEATSDQSDADVLQRSRTRFRDFH